MTKNFKSQMEAAGFKMKIFRVEHLEEISTVLEELAAKGLLDKEFYKEYLTGFKYDYKDKLESPKSVVLIAAPQYQSFAEFKHQNNTLRAVIPPTYIYPEIDSQAAGILKDTIGIAGCSIVSAVLPLKLLAVRSGLGMYGRNNICYVPGFGSFIRLLAFITDYEFDEDSWGEIRVMESCDGCSACIDSCPTRAIDRERFLIHAENCITNFNEHEAPMPNWVSSQWHDSIVGCMKCQAACPHNQDFLNLVDKRICFDEAETTMILEGQELSKLPEITRTKISNAGIEWYYKVLPRNIRLLIDKAY